MGSLHFFSTTNDQPIFLPQLSASITAEGDDGILQNANNIHIATASNSVRIGNVQNVIEGRSLDATFDIARLLSKARKVPKKRRNMPWAQEIFKQLDEKMETIKNALREKSNTLTSHPQPSSQCTIDAKSPFYVIDPDIDDPTLGCGYHCETSYIAIDAPDEVSIQRDRLFSTNVEILSREGNEYSGEFTSLAESLLSLLSDYSRENTKEILKALHENPTFVDLLIRVSEDEHNNKKNRKSA